MSHCVSFVRPDQRSPSRTFGLRPATGSKQSRAIVPGSTASGSMTSGGSASCGPTPDGRRWRSLTAIDRIEPIHPGEVLMEGFGITQNKLAVSIAVPPRQINEIVDGKRAITADTALRLAK